MGLDIRLPIGMMFSLLGALLVIYGFVTQPDSQLAITTGGLSGITDSSIYKSSLGLNVNLWWGLVLLVFGAVMLFFALRARFAKK